jgi:hypothetical protein
MLIVKICRSSFVFEMFSCYLSCIEVENFWLTAELDLVDGQVDGGEENLI